MEKWTLPKGAALRILCDGDHAVMHTAAEQLLRYLHAMCDIIEAKPSDAAFDTTPTVFLSQDASLSADAFRLRMTPEGLCLIGQNGRGLLYAVFELLERLGCRFYATDTEIIPKLSEIALPYDLDVTESSPFEYRDLYWVGTTDPLTAVKLRINGVGLSPERHIRHIPEPLGGGIGYAGPHFVHTFSMLLPAEKYFEAHPEYYALIDGERTGKHLYSQPCLSNPDVRRIMTEGIRSWLRAEPNAKLVSVSQNDSYVIESYCTCPECQKVMDEEGSPSGPLIRFVNAIAEELEPEFPEVVFDTLAYQYSSRPPKITKPRHNVAVRMCTGSCPSHPIAECPNNAQTAQSIRTWAEISDHLYIWDYTTDFAQYLNPFPNFQTLQANVRFFRDNHVKGVFEQGTYSGGLSGEFGELRSYLLAKLLWDPEFDVESGTEAFLHVYYGGGAPYVRQYLTFIQEKVRDVHFHVMISAHELWNDRISEDELIFLDQLWNDAYRAALAGDDVTNGIPAALCAQHVERSSLCHRWFKLNAGRGEFSHPDQLPHLRENFYRDCARLGVTHMAEGTNIPWVQQTS